MFNFFHNLTLFILIIMMNLYENVIVINYYLHYFHLLNLGYLYLYLIAYFFIIQIIYNIYNI
jgi:hypothetical protein